MKQKEYITFKPGDEVCVIPEELAYWNMLNNRDGQKPSHFVVASVRDAPCKYCAGHPQQLTMTDGTSASGKWFDSHSPANGLIEPIGCNSGGPDLGGGWFDPAPQHIGGPNKEMVGIILQLRELGL